MKYCTAVDPRRYVHGCEKRKKETCKTILFGWNKNCMLVCVF